MGPLCFQKEQHNQDDNERTNKDCGDGELVSNSALDEGALIAFHVVVPSRHYGHQDGHKANDRAEERGQGGERERPPGPPLWRNQVGVLGRSMFQQTWLVIWHCLLL